MRPTRQRFQRFASCARAVRRLCACALLVCCGAFALGCSGAAQLEDQANARTTITLDLGLEDYGIWLDQLKAKFPDIKFEVRLLQNNDPATEMQRRVKHGDVSDIILSNELSRDLDGLQDSLMDLAGKPYTSSYMTSFLDNVNMNGSIYFLPSQVSVLGLSCNTTLLDRYGIAVPTDFGEYADSCRALDQAGITPSLATYGRDHGASLFYRLLAVNETYTLDGSAWLARFNKQKASLTEANLDAVFNDIDALVAAGACAPTDADMVTRWRTYDLQAQNQTCYVESYGHFVNTLHAGQTDSTMEMIPYYGSSNATGYLFAVPQVYIAVGKSVQGTEKEPLVDEVLSYLSSEAGQKDIMAITNSAVSPVLGVSDSISDPFLNRVTNVISDQRLLALPYFTNCHATVSALIDGYIAGKVSREDVIAGIDAANAGRAENPGSTEVGRATADFSYEQTSAAMLDAMREATGCDMAISSYSPETGGGLYRRCASGKIYEGPITEADIMCISPFFTLTDRIKPEIDTMVVTGHQLLKMVEYENSLFYVGFGAEYRYDENRGAYLAAALYDENGNPLDLDATYSVATMNDVSISEEMYVMREDTEITLYDAFHAYVENKGTLTPPPADGHEFNAQDRIS